jgi:hypothetical protein
MASPSIDAGESSVTLPPEYQESYLKSLLASIYNPYAGNIVDAEGKHHPRRGDAETGYPWRRAVVGVCSNRLGVHQSFGGDSVP